MDGDKEKNSTPEEEKEENLAKDGDDGNSAGNLSGDNKGSNGGKVEDNRKWNELRPVRSHPSITR